VKGLREREHSALDHLVNCPSRTAGYRTILKRFRVECKEAGRLLVETAVIYLDADLLKWILRSYPVENGHVNDIRFRRVEEDERWSGVIKMPDVLSNKITYHNLLSWVQCQKNEGTEVEEIEMILRSSGGYPLSVEETPNSCRPWPKRKV